jgi:uncharacterized phage protein (TIGR02218 family)
MTWLDRPVLDLRPHFASPVEGSDDDATREAVGFGVPTPWRTQANAQRRWRLRFQLDRAEIRALEDFFDARGGASEGFWLPTWNNDFRLAAGVLAEDTTFLVEATGFPAYFAEHPGNAQVVFILPDGTVLPRTITGAVESGDLEEVTLAEAAGFICPAETLVSQLVYVRFAKDKLTFSYESDSLAEVKVELLELPEEYAAAVEAVKPAWLYELTQSGNVWRWTSHGETLNSGGEDWEPADITHTRISKSTNFFDEGVTLRTGIGDDSHPFVQFIAGAPANPLGVKIYQVFFPDLELGDPVYEADVTQVTFAKRGVAEATLTSLMRIAEARVPRVLIQASCNWRLYESNTCKVSEAAHSLTTTLDDADALWVEAAAFEGADPNQWALGVVVAGEETRLVVRQDGARLYLSAPFRTAPGSGDTVTVRAGCDKKLTTCIEKFNNLVNFGGFPYVPTSNPQMEALSPPKTGSSGGKGK